MERPQKTQRALETAARWLALGTVALSPWLFGAAEPWAYLSLNTLACLAGMAWLLGVLTGTPAPLRCPRTTLVLLALSAFVWLQGLSLPDAVVAVLNRPAWLLAGRTRDLLAQIGIPPPAALSASDRPLATLSLTPAAARHSVYLWAAYVAVWLVGVNTCRRWRHLRQAAALLTAGGFLLAVVGLVHKLSGSPLLLWFHEPRHGGSLFGPFTNRNHFAAHANLLLGVALGLLLAEWHSAGENGGESWRERLARLSTARASGVALSAFAAALLAGAVCATLSRGGVLSLAVAMALLGAVAVWRRDLFAGARPAVAVAVGLAVLMAGWLGSDPMLERLGSLREVAAKPSEDLRTVVTLDTLRMALAHPLCGIGFGGFRHAYSMVQTPSLQYRWLHAHNDWAQLLAEGGAAGTALFLAAAAALTMETRRGLRMARARARRLAVGLTVGLVAMAVHSLVDYSLHKPANALLLAAVAALLGAAAHLRPPVEEDDARLSRNAPAEGGHGAGRLGLGRAAALAGLLLLTVVATLQIRELRGELALARFHYARRVAEAARNAAERERAVTSAYYEIDLAVEFARQNPDELAEASSVLCRWQADTRLPRGLRTTAAEKAVLASATAVRGAPSDYLTWLSLARGQMSMAMWDEAEVCLRRARELVRHPGEVRMFDVVETGEEVRIP